MNRITRLCGDATCLGVLICSLLVVYRVDRDRQPGSTGGPPPPATSGESVTVETNADPLELAVTAGGYDDMLSLLRGLGDGYRCTVVDETDLLDPAASEKFDAVFLTCAERDAGSDDGRLAGALRDYVRSGGTLYASDLRFDTLAAAFPEAIDPVSVAQGKAQDLKAAVVSPELRDLLGDEVPLHFDQEGWRPAAFRGAAVTVYLDGTLRTTAGVEIRAPLLARFSSGKGAVVFTSFHNEKQVSEIETRLLNHLVVSTVTARVETTVTQTMIRGGFSPRRMNVLSAAPGDSAVTRTYEHRGPGRLTFTLGFEPRGARLALEVISPSGESRNARGSSTVTIDVDDPSEGVWTYKATPEVLPYANFPFTLAVGAARPGELAGGERSPQAPEPDESRTPVAGRVVFKLVETGLTPGNDRAKRIAVSEPEYDDVGKLLNALGEGYRHVTIPTERLLVAHSLDDFDIFFLTCDGYPAAWGRSDGASNRPGLGKGTPREEIVEQVGETLRRFVRRGGTLYASDLRIGLLFWAFPERRGLVSIDLSVLDAFDEMEREWLDLVSLSPRIKTVGETLRGLDLSPGLVKDFRRLHATIEWSSLARGRIEEKGYEPEVRLQNVFKMAGLPATDGDVKTISDAFRGWERSIRQKLGTRSRVRVAQTQLRFLALKARLDSLRDALGEGVEGAGNQEVRAEVVEPGLRDLLGETLSLNFNANGWQPSYFQGDDVVDYLRGSFRTVNDRRVEAPLLSKFNEGKGQVIFTSFHNEAQNSRGELELLKYLVFSAVTAKEQGAAEQSMLSGGFPTTQRSLASHSAGSPSLTRSYTTARDGTVRFALTFPGTTARLKLTINAPTGQTFERETGAPIIVEGENAPAGEWRYTITAVKVPYENFPYSLSVAERQADPGAP